MGNSHSFRLHYILVRTWKPVGILDEESISVQLDALISKESRHVLPLVCWRSAAEHLADQRLGVGGICGYANEATQSELSLSQ